MEAAEENKWLSQFEEQSNMGYLGGSIVSVRDKSIVKINSTWCRGKLWKEFK